MPIFRVLHNNTDHNRKVYQAGDLIDSDQDLTLHFGDKFAPVGNVAHKEVQKDVPAGQQLAEQMQGSPTSITTDERHAEAGGDGKDATGDVLWAEEATKYGITVKYVVGTVAKGGGYFLHDGETKINATGLKKSEVLEAITAYAK